MPVLLRLIDIRIEPKGETHRVAANGASLGYLPNYTVGPAMTQLDDD